jgi:hypothetical protein
VIEAKKQMMKIFDWDKIGELKEYVGCKVEYKPDEGLVRMTQPVLLQSFKVEFE